MRRFQLFTYENGLLILLGVTFGIVFIDRGAVNILMPFIVKDLHLSNTQIGFVGSSLALTWALSNMVAGRLSDTMGRRKPLLIGAVVVFSVCSFISGLATSFLVLVAARLFMGFAEGPVPPLSAALIAEASSPKRRGLNGGMFIAFNPLIAAVLAPPLLVLLAQSLGWRSAFYIAGVPGLIAATLLWKFVRENDARATSSGDEVQETPAASSTPHAQDKPLPIIDVLRTRNIWLCTIIIACLMASLAVDGIFFPLYYVNVRHVSPEHTAFLLSAIGLASLPVLCFLPALADRIGRKPVVAFFSFVGIIGPSATLFFHGPLPILAALLMTAVTFAVSVPLVILVIPSESLPARSMGTALGFIPGVGELVGSFGAPTLAGWIADRTSLAAPFLIEIACFLAAGTAALFLKETLSAKVQSPVAAVAAASPVLADESRP